MHSRISRMRNTRPRVEVLEDRTMFSISLPAAGTTGPAVLTGTPFADHLILRLQPGAPANVQLSDNGGASFATAPLSAVTGVTVNGLAGRDTLTIDNASGLVSLAITYHGGQAPDALVLAGNPTATVSQTYQV